MIGVAEQGISERKANLILIIAKIKLHNVRVAHVERQGTVHIKHTHTHDPNEEQTLQLGSELPRVAEEGWKN